MTTGARRRRSSPVGALQWIGVAAAVVLAGVAAVAFLRPRGAPGKTAARAMARDADVKRTDPASKGDRQPGPAPAAKPGPALALRFCPQGGQGFFMARPAELLSTHEGPLIQRALGPAWNDALAHWQKETGITTETIRQVTISWLPDDDGHLQSVVAVQLTGAVPERWRRESPDGHAPSPGAAWISAGDFGALVVAEHPYPWLVFGPKEVVQEIQRRDGRPPLLPRDLERLRTRTPADRHCAILFVPRILAQQGPEAWPQLPESFYLFLTDTLAGAQAVSMAAQLTQDAWAIEARVAADLEDVPRIQQEITEALRELPARVAKSLGDIEAIDPYWRQVAARFPAMLQYLSDHTRIAKDSRDIVASSRLPARAAHNLILATELSVSARPIQSADPMPAEPTIRTPQELLAAHITVRLPRCSLDDALSDLDAVIQDELRPALDIQIVVDGASLRNEGITRNQQITDFHMADATVSAILTELVLRANPQRPVQGPADPRQKLVWLLEPWQTGQTKAVIRITTRAGAAESESVLPDVFRES